MDKRWMKVRKWCVLISCGGYTPGILQGLGMVSFAQIAVTVLALWFSAVVVTLLGGDPSNLF